MVERATSLQQKVIGYVVIGVVVAAISWGGWAFIGRPWHMTNAFFALAAGGDASAIRARLAPDHRAGVKDEQIRTWIDGIRGSSGWSFARKGSTYGTTRGGHAVCTQSGYIRYPSSTDERSFSLGFIEMDGTWYVDSVMLGSRETPR